MEDNKNLMEEIVEIISKEFVWNVQDFFNLSREIDTLVKSPSFSFSGAKWYMQMYPNGETRFNSEGWIGLYLFRYCQATEKCHVTYSLGIKKEDGTDYVTVNFEKDFSENQGHGRLKLIEISKLIKKKSQVAPQDSVKFFCKVCYEVNESTEAATQTVLTEGLESLHHDLREFLKGEDADVIFRVKNEEFKAHKAFLRVRSPVFKAMFGHNMKENSSKSIDVTDCDPTVFKDFMHFIYCGKVEQLSVTSVFDLYFLADKYDILQLRNVCVDFIINNMSMDIFFNTLNLALRHNEARVLEHATSFFVENTTEICETAEWLSFLKENFVVANELFLKTLKFQRSTCSETK